MRLAKQFGAEDLDALKGQIAERLEAEYKVLHVRLPSVACWMRWTKKYL